MSREASETDGSQGRRTDVSGEADAPSGRSLAALFAIALGVRAIVLFELSRTSFFSFLLGDSLGYHLWAERIAAGDWLGEGVFYQAPLYPYFIGVLYGAFGSDPLVVKLAQMLLDAVSCVLLASAGARFFRSARIGLGAGLLAGLYAPAIFFVALVQKASLAFFLTCVVLELLSRVTRGARSALLWCALGLALGLLALTRENALLFIPIVGVWLLWQHRDAPRRQLAGWLALLVLGSALPLGLVSVRNRIVGGEFALTTSQFGTNFFIGNNANAEGFYIPLRLYRGNVRYERSDAVALAEEAMGRKLSPAEVSSFWTRQALDYIEEQPLDWLALMGRKALLVWNRVEASDGEDIAAFRRESWMLDVLARPLNFGVLVPLAALGVWATRRSWRELWILYAMVLTYAASLTIFFLFARYRFPLVPFALVFAAVGVREIVALVRDGRARGRAQAALVLASAAIVANLPLTDTESQLAAAYKNFGGAMLAEERYAEAIGLFEESLRHRPDAAESLRGIAEALAYLGRLEESEQTFQRALAVAPNDALALLGLGQVQLLSGKEETGRRTLARAVEADPTDARAAYHLGMHHAHAGRPREAIPWLRRAAEREGAPFGARLELAKAFYLTGDASHARAEAEWIVQRNPRDVGASLLLARLLEEDRQWMRALDLCRAVLEQEPENTLALRQCRRLTAKLGGGISP